MKKEQFEEISAWQEITFPTQTAFGKVQHLKEEVIELSDALEENDPKKRLEWADCIILSYASAAKDGMSYEDICNAINEKMEINKARKWGVPNANGVINHIKD